MYIYYKNKFNNI